MSFDLREDQRPGADATAGVASEDPDATITADALPLVAGRYRILGRLGAGAFGEVLDAFDEELRRPVALKRLRAEVQLDRETRERFVREVRVLARLDHPNIVPLLDARLEDERPFLVMTRVDGVSLATHASRRAPTWGEAVRLAIEVARGLGHAHAQGVLHRDVKPSNVLCSREGRILIADFGLSSAPFLTSLTTSGDVVGTLHYMAPESLSGRWDPRSDIYSLGAVLYELLFRSHLFEADDRRVLIAQILSEVPRRLLEPSPELPRALAALLGRVLAKDPDLRPASCRDLLAELEASLGGLAGETTAIFSPSAARTESLLSSEIERLEHDLDEVQRATERPGASLEDVLVPLSHFVEEGGRLVSALRIETADPHSSSGVVVETVLGMVDSVVQAVTTSRWRSDVQGVLLQVERSIGGPLRALRRPEQARSSAAVDGAADFFAFEDHPATAEQEAVDWLEDLLGDDELARYRALTHVLGPGREVVLARLASAPAECAVVLRALWPMADLLLSEGRGGSRPIFELAIERTAEPRLREMWTRLFLLFKKSGGAYWDPVLVQAALADYAEPDRRIFGRAFLTHPEESYRRLGLDLLQPVDLWYSIVSERTPLAWMLEIWRHLRHRAVRDDYFKIFFSCIHERLADVATAEPGLVVDFLREFVRVDAFLENQYFSRIARFNERIRTGGPDRGGLADLEAAFVEELRSFLERPRRLDRPVEGWGSVPLPIQRLLARRGLFQRHFACHPKDLIAFEVLRHVLVREDVTEFLQLFAINSRLLGELCKEGRFFQHEAAKYALVANPKTPAHVVLNHIGYLRADSLLRLRESRDCNPLARTWASRAAERRAGRDKGV